MSFQINKQLPSSFGFGNTNTRKFWLSPDGKIYGVIHKTHPDWAEEYLKFINTPISQYPISQLYKDGWIRMYLGFDYNNQYVLHYEHYYREPSSKLKKLIKDFAVEMNVEYVSDINGKYEMVAEIRERDIKMRHPQTRNIWDKNWNPKFDKMTLDNLKSMRNKIYKSIAYCKKNKLFDNLNKLVTEYSLYDTEIKRRLQYINNSVNENITIKKSKLKNLIKEIIIECLNEDRGSMYGHNQVPQGGSNLGGYSHNSSCDYSDIQLVRDPLNDPLLNNKLDDSVNQNLYRFRDFPLTKTIGGFGMSSDVFYKNVYLGVIESESDGYFINKVVTPDGRLLQVLKNENNKFKSKNLAAHYLDYLWRQQRSKHK